MILDRVTFTGADDSIQPADLLPLTRDFPFVEWGILYSEKHSGSSRFPSDEWIAELEATKFPLGTQLSMHLCGQVLRDLASGNFTNDESLPPFWFMFDRAQLNWHGERVKNASFPLIAKSLKFWSDFKQQTFGNRPQFIFQADGRNDDLLGEATGFEEFDGVILFDRSHGGGVSPDSWPKPIYMSNDVDHCYHGYAGGLGPDNLADEIPRIAEAAGNCHVWIDMETKVFTAGRFDLAKVRQCLEICKPFVTQLQTRQ